MIYGKPKVGDIIYRVGSDKTIHKCEVTKVNLKAFYTKGITQDWLKDHIKADTWTGMCDRGRGGSIKYYPTEEAIIEECEADLLFNVVRGLVNFGTPRSKGLSLGKLKEIAKIMGVKNVQ